MKAKVTVQFRGVIDGEVYPRLWPVGSIIEGDLARSAIAAGQAKAIEGAPENKMMEGARLGEPQSSPIGGGKLSSSPRRGRPKVEKK